MILSNELILTKPILGCKNTEGKPRQLLRDEQNLPGLVDVVWKTNFEAAASALGIEFTSDMVSLPTGYQANKTEEFLRTYSKFKKERFESIPKGSRISFDVILNDNKLPPRDYAKILAVVGERFGISQFGNKFGFGRFKVEFIKRKSVDVKLDFEYPE